MKKLIAIFIALIITLSIAYAPRPNDTGRRNNEAFTEEELSKVELQLNNFDLSSAKPELTQVTTYHLLFPNDDATMEDGTGVKSLFLSKQGAFYEDSSNVKKEMMPNLLENNNFVKVIVSRTPFWVYRTNDVDGQGTPAFVFQDTSP